MALNLATFQHHSYMKSAVVDVGVQVGSPLAPVIEYMSSAPVKYLAPAPAVSYPSSGLVDLQFSPTDRAQRHTVEQRIEHTPYVQILDAPVPLKVIPQRSVDLVPQMVEQLVEVPTVLTPTRIAVQIAEQIVDIPASGKVLNKEVDLGEPTSSLDHVYLGCTQRQCEISKDIVDNYRTMFESRISAEGLEKLPFPQNLRISSWSYDMAGHAKKCVERYCELTNKTTQQLYKVSTPCIDDHHFKEEEMKSVGELSQVCTQIVLKCLYLARIGRPDIPWSANKLARSITKWTKACDKRLNRLISYIHHTCEYKQYCHVGNTAKQCRLGLFQDSDFAGDLEDSESTSGGTLCVFGSHTFVPISWMCKKQTSVSHSSTESEIISLDTGLRLDGLPALELWDLIVCVLGNVSRVSDRSGQPDSDVQKLHKSHNKIDVMKDIDSVPSNVQSARQEALLYVFEDNEAVIKMIMKGRSPTMRHVSRTHRVALDWLFDRTNLDSKIQIKCIDTKNQLADILTKGNFTRDEWNHLLNLFNISHFSSTACSAAMAKRAQQGSGEERVTAKSRPMMNLTARMPSVVSSSTSSNPVRTSYGYQDPGKSVARETIDQGNLRNRHHQVIQKRIMVNLGLLKSGKVELRRTIDQGNLMKLLGMRCNKFVLIMKNLFSTEMRNP